MLIAKRSHIVRNMLLKSIKHLAYNLFCLGIKSYIIRRREQKALKLKSDNIRIRYRRKKIITVCIFFRFPAFIQKIIGRANSVFLKYLGNLHNICSLGDTDLYDFMGNIGIIELIDNFLIRHIGTHIILSVDIHKVGIVLIHPCRPDGSRLDNSCSAEPLTDLILVVIAGNNERFLYIGLVFSVNIVVDFIVGGKSENACRRSCNNDNQNDCEL